MKNQSYMQKPKYDVSRYKELWAFATSSTNIKTRPWQGARMIRSLLNSLCCGAGTAHRVFEIMNRRSSGYSSEPSVKPIKISCWVWILDFLWAPLPRESGGRPGCVRAPLRCGSLPRRDRRDKGTKPFASHGAKIHHQDLHTAGR